MKAIEAFIVLALIVLIGSLVLPQRVLVDQGPVVHPESWPIASDHRH